MTEVFFSVSDRPFAAVGTKALQLRFKYEVCFKGSQAFFLRTQSLSNAGWYTVKKRELEKGNRYLTENRLSRNEIWWTADNYNDTRHTCEKGILDSSFN